MSLKPLNISITKEDIVKYDNSEDNSSNTKNIQNAFINHLYANNSLMFGDEILIMQMGRNIPEISILASFISSYNFIINYINSMEIIKDEEKVVFDQILKKLEVTKINNKGENILNNEFINKYIDYISKGNREFNMIDNWKISKMEARKYYNMNRNMENMNDYPDVIYPISYISRYNRENQQIMDYMYKNFSEEDKEIIDRKINIFTKQTEDYIDAIKNMHNKQETNEEEQKVYDNIIEDLSSYDHNSFIKEREIKSMYYYNIANEFISKLKPENRPTYLNIKQISSTNPYTIDESHTTYEDDSSYRTILDKLDQLTDNDPTKKAILAQLNLTIEQLREKANEEEKNRKSVDTVKQKLIVDKIKF